MANPKKQQLSLDYKPKKGLQAIKSHLANFWELYVMLIPGFVCLLIFSYLPMYGITLAFKTYKPNLGIMGSPWAADIFQNFKYVFSNYGFGKLVRNTLFLGLLNLIFAFPSSIILALQINEIKNKFFKKTVQTVSYIPYFISWVVISGIAYSFLSQDYGLINGALKAIGILGKDDVIKWYSTSSYWPWLLTFVGIWKTTGWGTIVFLSGIVSIDPTLYEAAVVDGAGRWKQTLHVTLPGLMPVIAITFTLTIANIVKDDFEKIYALVGENSMLYEHADVLGTWTYRTMRSGFKNYGQVTVVTLLQGLIGLIMMTGANWLVKKTDNPSLW